MAGPSDPKKFMPSPEAGKTMDGNTSLGGTAKRSSSWNAKNEVKQYSNGGSIPKGELGAGKNG